MPLPRCFFDITINGVPTGRIVFELFSDVCPKTVENFRCLCTGEKGEGRNTFKPLHYLNTPIHRIVKGFIVQGGDFSTGDGTGGESIYGGTFKDENFQYKHDRPFLLSMANKGPNTNGSQFFITTRPAPHLDGLHVVFGHVVGGTQYVTEMENQKVDANHRPYADVRISCCGELVLIRSKKGGEKKKKANVESSPSESEDSTSEDESESESESESEESSSEEERKRKSRKKKKKRSLKRKQRDRGKRKRKEKKKRGSKRRHSSSKKVSNKKRKKKVSESSESESDSSAESEQENGEPVSSTILDPGVELPPEIDSSTTSRSWLYRRSRTPSPKDDDESKKPKRRRSTSPKQSAEAVFKPRENLVSQSGRKLKGRGFMRYHTPPRFGYARQTAASRDTARQRDRSNRRSRSPRRTWRDQRSRSNSRSRERVPFRTGRMRAFDDSPPFQSIRRQHSESPDTTSADRRGRRGSRDRDDKQSERREDKRQTHRRRTKDDDDDGDNRVVDQREERTTSMRHRSSSSSHSREHSDVEDRGRHHRRRRSRSCENKRSEHNRRSRSPSPHRRLSYTRRRSKSRSRSRSPIEQQKGKWARHKDSTGGDTSSSDTDGELERAYHENERSKAVDEADREDVFGISKIL